VTTFVPFFLRVWMWRPWAGVVTRVLLDVMLNFLKYLWRQLMVEKWTFNSRATTLVDIPAVSMNECVWDETSGRRLCAGWNQQ